MDEKLKYDLDFKDIKDKLFSGIPILMFVILFLFSILSQLITINFDFKLIITFKFWISLIFKYFLLIMVFVIMFPFFKRLLKKSDDAKRTKDKANQTRRTVEEKHLSNDLKVYTKDKMKEEEKDFFLQLLGECGNIPHKYLETEYTLKVIRAEYKNGVLNKPQHKLLKLIKTGRIKFSKLKGDEIKFVAVDPVKKNYKYKDQGALIIKSEFFVRLIVVAFLAILNEFVTKSLYEQEIILNENWLNTIGTIITIALNYGTAVYFAFSVANKVVDEWLRFTEVVIDFTKNFLEDIATKKYIPLVERKTLEVNSVDIKISEFGEIINNDKRIDSKKTEILNSSFD